MTVRYLRANCILLALVTCSNVALAPAALAQSPSDVAQTPKASTVGDAPKSARVAGVAVLGSTASREDALVVARNLYATRLRPTALDERHARVLAGEAPPEDAPSDLRDLAELREAIVNEDAPSRRLLASVASQFDLAGIVVVHRESQAGSSTGSPSARVFLTDTGTFDAARYEPDARLRDAEAWNAVVASITRLFPEERHETSDGSSRTPSGNVLFVPPVSESKTDRRNDGKPFYASPWFWGALGGAALLGTGIFFATRGSESDSIQLRMQVPK